MTTRSSCGVVTTDHLRQVKLIYGCSSDRGTDVQKLPYACSNELVDNQVTYGLGPADVYCHRIKRAGDLDPPVTAWTINIPCRCPGGSRCRQMFPIRLPTETQIILCEIAPIRLSVHVPS